MELIQSLGYKSHPMQSTETCNKTLLDIMTKYGLLDVADCVKYEVRKMQDMYFKQIELIQSLGFKSRAWKR